MGSFGQTIREFSKSQEGRQCLEVLFNYDALPNPNLTCISNDEEIAKDILGRAFEYLLQLVIERQNPTFEFEVPFKRRFGDARTKQSKEIKNYFESGEPTEALLDLVIALAQERQKAFQTIRSRLKSNVQDGLKIELQRVHKLASTLKWNVKDSFYRGWLTNGRVVTAEADLIIDANLIEVKTTEDTRKWVAKIVETRREDFHTRTSMMPRKIVLPKNFLLENC